MWPNSCTSLKAQQNLQLVHSNQVLNYSWDIMEIIIPTCYDALFFDVIFHPNCFI